jgi:two-component system chemotaxis sensor kinase CheA
MNKKQEEFLKELLSDFKIEAAEHRQFFVNALLDLEKSSVNSDNLPIIERMFREIHSLKGAARAVSLMETETLCQSMENVLSLIKQGNLDTNLHLFDSLHQAVDLLDNLLEDLASSKKTVRPDHLNRMIIQLESFKSNPATGKEPESRETNYSMTETPAEEHVMLPAKPLASKETVRVSTDKLETILTHAEELIASKATLHNLAMGIRNLAGHPSTLSADLPGFSSELERFYRSFSRQIDDLLIDIKQTLLIPFSSLLELLPKLVRDLSREQGKEIDLKIMGGEIEIDRRILEGMKDPMIHIIRNCIDHGIQKPEIRKKLNKPACGSIAIEISQNTDRQVVITISDDGQGIDPEKVVDSAIRQGMLSAEAAKKLSGKEIPDLIFRSGVSTSPFITDISGRGLGLAIAAEKVSNLTGTIRVESEKNAGTRFIIMLPLTLATFRGVIVQVGEQELIIPTNAIMRAMRIDRSEIRTVENHDTITFGGHTIALVRLSDVLGIMRHKQKINQDAKIALVVLSNAQRNIAFAVDRISVEQEGIVKPFGPQLRYVRNITGATILGDGRIIPVLNVPELIETAIRTKSETYSAEAEEGAETVLAEKQTILVVEDSITARSLLRNIIESAGFDVTTAVDGVEAMDVLKKEQFTLVVSDIEMPRMNGIELTTRIRSDQELADLPVILVTALESADDRQRGMEAGANAYINKSNFEQNNLIETIQRLI